MRAREALASPLFGDAPIGMLLVDGEGLGLGANRAWCVLSGRPAEASLGAGWLEIVIPPDQARVRQLVADARSDAPHAFLDARLVESAPVRWGRFAVSRTASLHGGHGPELLISLADVSVDRALLAQLRHAATHDPLTGAANRFLFLEAAHHALARLSRHPGLVGILYIDLNEFKEANDRWGHVAGDHLLVRQVERLRGALRPVDLLGRLGGDEFAVLCEDLEGLYQLEAIAGRIASRLDEPIERAGEAIAIPASVGAVITSSASTSAERLLDVADRAMYRAKRRHGPPEVVVDVGSKRVQTSSSQQIVT